MATLVSFHAHPDDEAIGCGGTLAKASADGHRVVVVTATRGEHGNTPDGLLQPGEQLSQRRVAESLDAGRILGVHRWEFLDYVDSGMMGWPANTAPGSFWQADVEKAARSLTAILDEERADVLTIYDPVGVSGHPDHIQVHRVGARAATLAGTPRVYEGTMNRTQIQRLVQQAAQLGVAETRLNFDLDSFGMPEELITTTVDVRDYLPLKRRAMAAHASQIAESSFFLAMPPEVFAEVWGYEWFVRRGAPPGTREAGLFEALA
jgi:LmbE family N-acetylglucosaminyl deacetylase